MTSPLDEKAEHPRIWLEPAGAPDRCWCILAEIERLDRIYQKEPKR